MDPFKNNSIKKNSNFERSVRRALCVDTIYAIYIIRRQSHRRRTGGTRRAVRVRVRLYRFYSKSDHSRRRYSFIRNYCGPRPRVQTRNRNVVFPTAYVLFIPACNLQMDVLSGTAQLQQLWVQNNDFGRVKATAGRYGAPRYCLKLSVSNYAFAHGYKIRWTIINTSPSVGTRRIKERTFRKRFENGPCNLVRIAELGRKRVLPVESRAGNCLPLVTRRTVSRFSNWK